MNARERTARDAEVIQARARGFSWLEIGARFDLSDRQCRRIVADYRESRPRLHAIDPIEVVEDALEAYDAAISDLALLAERTKHDGTRLGATRSRLDALRGKMELMNAVGVLPNLGQIGLEVDAQRLVETIVSVFQDHGVPYETQKAIGDVLESPTGRDGRSAELVENHQNGALSVSIEG